MAWAISHAVQGEHFRRYTTEHVLPRLELAIAEVRAQDPRVAGRGRAAGLQDRDRRRTFAPDFGARLDR